MEKLLNLLNEYLGQTNIVVIEQEIEGRRDIFFENEDGFHAEEAEIISKKFGFIQWLRSNCKTRDLEEEEYLETGGGWVYSEYESMLMLLAIQDNPISFLISVLK